MKAYGYEWSWLLWNPDSAKKNFKKWEEGEHWPKPITPHSPL